MNNPTSEELELMRIAPAVTAATQMALDALGAHVTQVESVTFDHDPDDDLVTVDIELIDGRTQTAKALVPTQSAKPAVYQ